MTQKISKSNKLIEDLIPNISKEFSKKMYIANTYDVEISVSPEFIDSQISAVGSLYVWIYHVKIINKSAFNLKLINRHWKIIDEKGDIQEVDGEGVVGEKPLIAPGNNFQYSSGVHLRNQSGIMTGHYQMQKDDGEIVDVNIPTFSLDIPTIKLRIN